MDERVRWSSNNVKSTAIDQWSEISCKTVTALVWKVEELDQAGHTTASIGASSGLLLFPLDWIQKNANPELSAAAVAICCVHVDHALVRSHIERKGLLDGHASSHP